MKPKRKIGVVLQGGGALGAYQYGALKAFYEKDKNFSPSVVTGVSIGAINAAVLLGGKLGPVKSLDKIWSTLKMPTFPFISNDLQAKAAKFSNPAMYTLSASAVFNPLFAESLYDITPFKRLLKEVIDFDRLNSLEAKLVVESVNVETGELQRFSNHDKGGITLDHIISSMSIPPNFPMVKVGHDHFWDGGLYANMPLSPAINHLEASSKEEDVQRELIVISLFRKASPLPNNMYEISNRIKEIIFESKMGLDIKMFEMMDAQIDLMNKINNELPAESQVRNNPTFKKLLEHRKIDKRIFLKYQAEGVEGTDNFTAEKIDYRIKKGYTDASFHCV